MSMSGNLGKPLYEADFPTGLVGDATIVHNLGRRVKIVECIKANGDSTSLPVINQNNDANLLSFDINANITEPFRLYYE